MRSRYRGWMVLCSDRAEPHDHKVQESASEAEARALAAQLNARALANGPRCAPLFYCERWSTGSSLQDSCEEHPGDFGERVA